LLNPAVKLSRQRGSLQYVGYILNDAEQIVRILQNREGDICRPNGFSDVGVLALSRCEVSVCWEAYQKQSERGTQTGELNFLPFLAYLSSLCGWHTQWFEIEDACESRGINTLEDLTFFQELFASGQWTGVRGLQ